jgi:hypothetical protein
LVFDFAVSMLTRLRTVLLLIIIMLWRKRKMQMALIRAQNSAIMTWLRKRRFRRILLLCQYVQLAQAARLLPAPVEKNFGWWKLMWKDDYPEARFINEFRMCRASFNRLRDLLWPGEPWARTVTILGVALHRLAHRPTCRSLSTTFGIGDGQSIKYTDEAVQLLCAQVDQFIKCFCFL